MMQTLAELTVEHIGAGATEADLEQFRVFCRRLMAWDNYLEADAIAILWGGGDFYRNAEKYGVED